MAQVADWSQLVNRLSGGNSGTPQRVVMWREPRVGGAAAVSSVARRWNSTWQHQSSRGTSGATPTTVRAPTRTTDGAVGQADATGGRDLRLLGMAYGGVGNWPSQCLLYDRLLDIGGLSGTVTTAQTVAGSLTRNTGGEGNEIWAEVYTQIGATGTTITASYTNQAGTAGRTTKAMAIGATNDREVGRIIRFDLQDGDTGVQAVASVTVLATTGTAGNFGITVARPLVELAAPFFGYHGIWNGLKDPGGPVLIDAGACLALATLAPTSGLIYTFEQYVFAEF